MTSTFKTLLLIILIIITTSCNNKPSEILNFNKDFSFQHLEKQVLYGPRIPGTKAHENTITYITNELKNMVGKPKFKNLKFLDIKVKMLLVCGERANHGLLLERTTTHV